MMREFMTKTPPNFQPVIRYRLVEQFGDDRVKIRDLWHEQELIISVNKLVTNEHVMAQFSGNEACTLGYIFATQAGEVVTNN